MFDWYRVLDVRSGASDEEIKAAFRRLVKELHPDVRPKGDTDADRRFRLVVRAHETLSDPDLRAEYDAALAEKRVERRRRIIIPAATMAATFTFTLGSMLAVLQLSGFFDDRTGGEEIAAANRSAETDAWPAELEPDVRPEIAIILKAGATGDPVKELQARLGIQADGKFGPNTEEAVRDYQAQHGLEADGIAGPITLAHLELFGGITTEEPAGTGQAEPEGERAATATPGEAGLWSTIESVFK